jgi:hypothetical protein
MRPVKHCNEKIRLERFSFGFLLSGEVVIHRHFLLNEKGYHLSSNPQIITIIKNINAYNSLYSFD